MAVDEKLRQVRQQFEQKGIRLDLDWLSGCVEFFIDENPSIAPSQLFQQAQEQWELSDLGDSGIRCLPDTIFERKEIQSINGTFPLQLQSLLDISESPYDQLQRLQNKETEVAKEQPEFKQKNEKTKKKRMLKLELTDGFRTVSALEYKPIPCLTTQLTPGLKVIVTGPLRCVNHILFLEQKNIRILGGEVTAMVIENAYENILRKSLNQPINPNPITEYQEPSVATESQSNRLNSIPSIPMTAGNSAIQSNVISSAGNLDLLDDFPDDDFLTDLDIDQIASRAVAAPAESVSTARQNANNTIPPMRRSTLLFDDMDDNDFLNIDSTIEQANAAAPPSQNRPPTTDHFDAPSASAELVTDAELLNISTEPVIDAENYRFKIRGLNLVTVKQLAECAAENRKRRKFFIVKAEIDEIRQAARVSNHPPHEWKLSALITDPLSHNAKLKVSFSPGVIDKLAGVSGHELQRLNAMRNERPHVSEEIAAILRRLGEKLEEMYMFMKIQFDTDVPVVVELINAAPVLDRKLQEKIDYERLS